MIVGSGVDTAIYNAAGWDKLTSSGWNEDIAADYNRRGMKQGRR